MKQWMIGLLQKSDKSLSFHHKKIKVSEILEEHRAIFHG